MLLSFALSCHESNSTVDFLQGISSEEIWGLDKMLELQQRKEEKEDEEYS